MDSLPTQFAPAARADEDVIRRQAQAVLDIELLGNLYEAVSELVLILNAQRQIVFANGNFAAMTGQKTPQSLHGMRVGEALGCSHAGECASGCGTTAFCSTCGAVRAIMGSIRGQLDVQECRIDSVEHDALDLRVRTSPLRIGEETFIVCAIADISHEKRRRALERVFFHDILNTATGLKMLSGSVAKAATGSIEPLAKTLAQTADQLMEEILAQRDLMAAERSELAVRPLEIQTQDLLRDVLQRYAPFAGNYRCALGLDSPAEDVAIKTDCTLVSRVLGNMVKNAVEASAAGDVVRMGCSAENGHVTFHVHNRAVIPAEAQLQMFQRSFSTKGTGRGLGTYGMKLITERYLKGSIRFTSTPESGTTFFATYPKSL